MTTTARKTWNERYAEFLERVMASAVAGADPKSLQDELKRLLAERPEENDHGTES